MKRRSFVRNSALAAFAISNSGFIRFEGNRYVGDCETTTDILGPFYRPNGPLRTDLVISGEGGTKVLLEGVVKHSDCVTPFKKAKIELWHCDATGVYDNTSDEFRYRGTTYSDQRGRYFFNTILPVPYSASDTMTRPAHFHMMITAGGYQQLITQLYFEGDKFLNDDSYASSASARKRILKVQMLPDKSARVVYDIGLSKKLVPETAAVQKLKGIYSQEAGDMSIAFSMENDVLVMNDHSGAHALQYVGNNTFQDSERVTNFCFELLAGGSIKLQVAAGNNTNYFIKAQSS
jgi:protocatechuate 3,4-dioxygenase beta subunit